MRPRPPTDFPAFYAQHGPKIYRFGLGLCGSVSDAEDLTQDVFLAAFQDQSRFEGRASVQTWLYKIALNCWRHSRRVLQLAGSALPEDAPQRGRGRE